MNTSANKPNHETLSPLQRGLELGIVLSMLLLLAFLVYHQVANTGFYTASFGPLEMLCLYGPILVALIAPTVRALTGRRNSARPFEIGDSVFLTLGSLWLLIVFPFSFPHLADALPGFLRFILAWVPDDIGRLLLILQVIISPISAGLTAIRFFAVRRVATAA